MIDSYINNNLKYDNKGKIDKDIEGWCIINSIIGIGHVNHNMKFDISFTIWIKLNVGYVILVIILITRIILYILQKEWN